MTSDTSRTGVAERKVRSFGSGFGGKAGSGALKSRSPTRERGVTRGGGAPARLPEPFYAPSTAYAVTWPLRDQGATVAGSCNRGQVASAPGLWIEPKTGCDARRTCRVNLAVRCPHGRRFSRVFYDAIGERLPTPGGSWPA